MSCRIPVITCMILLFHATSSTISEAILSFIFALALVAFHGMLMSRLAGMAFTVNSLSSYLLPQKPLCMLVVCLLGTRSVFKTQLSVGLVITAVIIRVATLLTKHPLPEFHHREYGKSSYDKDDNAVAFLNRHILCRAIVFRSTLCLALLLFGTPYVLSLESTLLAVIAVVFGALAWTSLTFNVFDFDETLCGGNMDSLEHIDILGRQGVITRQPADSEIIFRKYDYTIPIGKYQLIADGETLKSAACESLDDLLGRDKTQVRYMGRQNGSIHRFHCIDDNQVIDIAEDRISRLAESRQLQIINVHVARRVPIIPQEVQQIMDVLHAVGQHDGILTSSPKHDIINKLMNSDEMYDLQIPVLSTGKWFSCKAWFFLALLDGVIHTEAELPAPLAGYIFGKPFMISTVVVAVAVAMFGPVLVTNNISSSEQTKVLDYVILWLSTWCACLFIGPRSICLYYDDNSRHAIALCSKLGVSSIHVANKSGHLTTKDTILLQSHHVSLFLSTTVFAMLMVLMNKVA